MVHIKSWWDPVSSTDTLKRKTLKKNSTGSLTSKVKVSVHEWHKDQNKMYILENKSETVIRETDIKMRSPLTITADDSQKHCMLFYSTHQVYLIGVILFSIYYILKTDIIFSSDQMYNVLQKDKYSITTDTFIINDNMKLCVNIYIQYIHVPKQ